MQKNYKTVITSAGTELMTKHMLQSTALQITQAAAGDGNGEYYEPTVDMTQLVNEKWRGSIAHVQINDKNANMFDVKIIIPQDVGGFTLRELGLFDKDGVLIAICNVPAVEKVITDNSVTGKLVIIMHITVTDAAALNFTIDSSIDGVSTDEVIELSAPKVYTLNANLDTMTLSCGTGVTVTELYNSLKNHENVIIRALTNEGIYLYLTVTEKSEKLGTYRLECVSGNDGFIAYAWDVTEKAFSEGQIQHATDTVVESGTSGDWSYRKWSSGVAECWCNTSLPFSEDQCADAGFSESSGERMNLMYTDLTLPFSFVATPCAVCSVEWKYSEWAQCHAGTKSLRVRLFCNGNSKTYAIENGLKCSIHVKGNWQ